MKKLISVFTALVISLFFLGESAIQAQTLVKNWGTTPRGQGGWQILNTASTSSGSASMGGTKSPTGFATIKGGFDSLTATTSKAFVITGSLEFVGGGGGSAYTWLRYSLFDEQGTLSNQNTDTASWSETSNGNGYIFTPVTGTGTIANTYNTWPQGNQGTEWPLINSKSWTSTNSNGGGPFSTVLQQPYQQVAAAGIYDFAISVLPLSSGGNQVNWYFIQEHTAGANNYYWWGGSFLDTTMKNTTFNSIGFGCNNDLDASCHQVNLTNVTVSLGSPITVPTAPFQAFYVNKWGSTPRGNAWPILNDSTYIDGNASMGNGKVPTAWASIKGGFNGVITATTSNALVVTGSLQFVGGGGGSAYTWLRYSLFNESGVLTGQNTDTAAWSETSTGNGYIFTPVSGTGTISNTYNTWPQGNQGTEWPLINSKSWTSTNSNGGGPLSTVLQQPYQQVAAAGIYDFAISVQPLSSGGNQVNWYFIQEHAAGSNNYYWWGGSFIDTSKAAPTSFNSIGFACNNDVGATEVKLTNVYVNLGSPITVPTAPFQAFYVNKWGATPRGKAWPILNDSTYIDGNAAMGNGKVPTAWASIKGGFNGIITATTSNALVVTGSLEFVGAGGGSAYTWLRYSLFNEKGELTGQNTDTAAWSEDTTGNGYIFTPVSGTGTISNTYNTWPQGNQGTEWPLINSRSWTSTNSNGGGPFSTVLQQPYQQVAAAGIYDFAISVQPLSSGGNQVNWYFIQEHPAGATNYYWWGGSFIDTSKKAPASFNSIGFACNNDVGATEVKLTNVYVNMGSAITVPTAPFQTYYISQWGFYGGRIGGWQFTPGTLTGNVTISGKAAIPSGSWSAVRGGFDGPLTPYSKDTALIVTGTVEFDGGGFTSAGSLRFGLFNSDSAGVVDTTYGVDSTYWSGSENYNHGYLFIPTSGSNTPTTWTGNKPGTFGAVADSIWLNTSASGDYVLGSNTQSPAAAAAGAGVYNFAISVAPGSNGGQTVAATIYKTDSSYVWTGIATDNSTKLVTTKFNSIAFALGGGNTTTAMKLTNVQVDLNKPVGGKITSVANNGNDLPKAYSLSQNYPNPFNPSTKIDFTLPKSGNVSLIVYDILGREITTLVNGNMNAGYYTINFNASKLASGVYFYRIKAGDFINVKKLLLLK